jgi:hypothetical protein
MNNQELYDFYKGLYGDGLGFFISPELPTNEYAYYLPIIVKVNK